MADVNRIAFTSNNGTSSTTLFLWTNRQLGQLAIPGATTQALETTSDAVLVALSTTMSPLTLPGRTSSGLRHVVSFDASLTPTASFSLPEATAAAFSWGLGVTSGGTGFLADGQLHWLTNGTLERLRPPLPLPTTTTRISGVPGPGLTSADDSLWLLARPDMDFGGVTGSTAVAQLKLF